MLAPVLRDQQPGSDETEFPAVTVRNLGRGKVIGIHGAFMESYVLCHHPQIRRFIGSLLESIQFAGRVNVSAPPSLEIALRKGEGFTAVHLVNRAANPTLTPRLQIVEDIPHTGPVTLELQSPQTPAAVTLEPGRRPVKWNHSDGLLRVKVPSVAIHDIVVIR